MDRLTNRLKADIEAQEDAAVQAEEEAEEHGEFKDGPWPDYRD